MLKKCEDCGVELEYSVKFCTNCGKSQCDEEVCKKCGAELKNDSSFCTECGAKADKSSISGGESVLNSLSILEKIKSKKALLLKVGGIVIVCLLILLVSASFGGRTNLIGKDSIITIKAEDMAKSYIRDQASAENKYKNKEIRISGTLIHKNQFSNSQDYSLYIYGQSVAGKVYKIVLSVPPENVSMVNQVNVGDFVNADGVCIGIVEQEDPTDIVIQINSTKINQ